MSSVKLVALRKHPFGTGEREKGEEYEATSDEAKVLVALGWAATAPSRHERPTPDAPPAHAQDPGSETAPVENEGEEPTKKRRGYQRRDMKAKD